MHKLFLFLLFLIPVASFAQNHRVYGYVMHKRSNETLIAAYVSDNEDISDETDPLIQGI